MRKLGMIVALVTGGLVLLASCCVDIVYTRATVAITAATISVDPDAVSVIQFTVTPVPAGYMTGMVQTDLIEDASGIEVSGDVFYEGGGVFTFTPSLSLTYELNADGEYDVPADAVFTFSILPSQFGMPCNATVIEETTSTQILPQNTST